MISKEQKNAARIIADAIHKVAELDNFPTSNAWILHSVFDTIAKGEAKSINNEFVVNITLQQLRKPGEEFGLDLPREALIALGSCFTVERERSHSVDNNDIGR